MCARAAAPCKTELIQALLPAVLPPCPTHLCHPALPRWQVARAADAALDAVAAGSPDWAASVRRLKFEAHNREWLLVIQSEQGADQQGLPPDGGAEGSSRPCGPYNLTTSAPVGAGAHGDDGPGFHGQYSQQGRIAAFWGPVSTGGAPPAATLAPQAVSAL